MFTGSRLAVDVKGNDNQSVLSQRGENLELFGLPALKILPPPNDSCDAFGLVLAKDKHQYVVKTNDYWPSLPLCELICHEIFEACGIDMLPWRQINLPDGRLGFGSRHLPNIFSINGQLNTPDQLLLRLENPMSIKSTIALDLFLYNEDRHWNNLIFVPVEDGRVRVYPIDFSRALFFHSFPPPEPFRMPISSHTLVTARLTNQKLGLKVADVDGTLRLLEGIDAAQIKAIVGRAPAEWAKGLNVAFLLDWWSSNLRINRINKIREGIANGSVIRIRHP